MTKYYVLLLLILSGFNSFARPILAGPGKSLQACIQQANAHDTVLVSKGIYKEGQITIDKPLTLIGLDLPILSGQHQYEIITVTSDSVTIDGFRLEYSGAGSLEDPSAIRVLNCKYATIKNCVFYDNFFSIYIQYGSHCHVLNNTLIAFGKEEQSIGNGIHCWKSDSLLIAGNKIIGHRDGIYLEFVTRSVIWRNIAQRNVRYGLHFMFSHNDSYIGNVFKANGAGVAVMFTKQVRMLNNTFENNWGDSSYGLLLKEISDAWIIGNTFRSNTIAVFMEGTNRIDVQRNAFQDNGWSLKIQASCIDNHIEQNNFISNTFDVATNGSLMLNTFSSNYWDKSEGYDLNRDGISDVPYRPLSLFSLITEKNNSAMLLYRSFIVSLMEKSEKVMPSITPEQFKDDSPLMKPLPL